MTKPHAAATRTGERHYDHHAEAVPHGRYLELAGRTHMVKAKVLAPVVTEYLLGT